MSKRARRWASLGMMGAFLAGCTPATGTGSCLIVDGFSDGVARVENTESSWLWVEALPLEGAPFVVTEGKALEGSVDCISSIHSAVQRLHHRLNSREKDSEMAVETRETSR